MSIEVILSIGLGIALAASSGFRVFVPLFALSLSTYFGILPLNDSWAWLGSTEALIILGMASIFESLSYLIPFVDNLLDTIAVPLAGVAGTLAMAASLTEFDPAITWALAIVAGGGAAATIKGVSAAGRVASSATTMGAANPALSVVETSAAVGLSALAIFSPILALLALALIFVFVIWLVLKLKKLKKQNPSKP